MYHVRRDIKKHGTRPILIKIATFHVMLRVFLKTHGLKLRSTNPLPHSKPKKKNHLFWIPSLISQLSYIIFSPINSLRILFIPIPHTTIKKKEKTIYILKHPISPSLSFSPIWITRKYHQCPQHRRQRRELQEHRSLEVLKERGMDIMVNTHQSQF